MRNDSLGDRMKSYENINRNYLMRRTPVIIRIDGKAFHTFTKRFQKPFDKFLMNVMQETMLYLCKNIQGCVLGYTQSDEITLVLCDYQTIDTDSWFGYNIQKMASVAASMATMAFNRAFAYELEEFNRWVSDGNPTDDEKELRNIYSNALKNGAMFDARCFNIPKEEVCNCLIWRQQDATRNSIQSVGQHYFSHIQLQNKTCDDIQDMLWKDCNINWNDYSTTEKRGSCCVKKLKDIGINYNYSTKESTPIRRMSWTIDNEIPIFTQNREYIENLINFN